MVADLLVEVYKRIGSLGGNGSAQDINHHIGHLQPALYRQCSSECSSAGTHLCIYRTRFPENAVSGVQCSGSIASIWNVFSWLSVRTSVLIIVFRAKCLRSLGIEPWSSRRSRSILRSADSSTTRLTDLVFYWRSCTLRVSSLDKSKWHWVLRR